MSIFGEYQSVRTDCLDPGEADTLLDPDKSPTITHVGFAMRSGTVVWERIEDVPVHSLFDAKGNLQSHVHAFRFETPPPDREKNSLP